MKIYKIILSVLSLAISVGLFTGLSFLSFDYITKRETFVADFGRAHIARPDVALDVNIVRQSESDMNLIRQVDFTELKSINSDVYSWVYLPDTNVDYYVMQEPAGLDNGEYFYLWKDIYKQENTWGSIFTPYVASDEDGATRLMFGHRMKDRTLGFSNLKLFLEQDYMDLHPYVYVYYPDRAERYAVWAACNADYMDVVYRILPVYKKGSPEYDVLLSHIRNDLAKSISDTVVTNEDELLILSTCYQDDVRMFLACALDKTHYYQIEERQALQ